MKNILRIFFVFLLPLSFLINWHTWVTWTAEYSVNGQQYTGTVRGFPFPDIGTFPVPNTFEWETVTNWWMLILNQVIILLVAFILYYFLLRRLTISTRTRKVVLTFIVLLIYSYFGSLLMYDRLQRTKYKSGSWPDNITTAHARYVNLWKDAPLITRHD